MLVDSLLKTWSTNSKYGGTSAKAAASVLRSSINVLEKESTSGISTVLLQIIIILKAQRYKEWEGRRMTIIFIKYQVSTLSPNQKK
jgi:hypothetical protein